MDRRVPIGLIGNDDLAVKSPYSVFQVVEVAGQRPGAVDLHQEPSVEVICPDGHRGHEASFDNSATRK